MADPNQAAAYIADLVKRARAAQKTIEFASQEQVDDLAVRVAWAGCKPDFAAKLADFAAEESQMGLGKDKYGKIMTKVKGALRDMKGKKTVGLVEVDEEKGLLKYAKPIGVVGALIPCTNPEATPFVKAIWAIKTRNAIILAPHPRTQKTNKMAVDQIRACLKKNGYSEDLVINVDQVSMEGSTELMKQADLVLATGGAGLVHAAYSSGTPAYGVGAGNAVCIVDETADLADAADKIKRSKIFDHATSCSTENAVAIQESVYDAMIQAMIKEGAYLVQGEEKKKLQAAMWEDGHTLSRKIVAQSAAAIAKLAGLNAPANVSFLIVPETGVGADYPFSGEKLSPVSTIYKFKTFDEAVDLVNRITDYSGAGHSCGIHTFIDSRVRELGRRVKVSRIMVRQPQCLANSGAWTNGMPMSMTLGCGTWGGNIASENISYHHLLNYTWVSYEIPNNQPSDEELFGTLIYED
ncbi:MAG: aldehyde dehydrogenase family protein [Spirochaetales bacterium]|nr:aldehyde dehydrogenase family protein [Spirochaetales bacterium]